MSPARSGKLVEKKEASRCENKVPFSGAFSTSWGRATKAKSQGIWLGERSLEGVAEDEYDYVVCIYIGDACQGC